jgi:Zn-dependent M28 family amino/carboxypeptidase
MSAISALASGPSPRVSTVLASVSALALLVLGACQTPTDAVRAAAVPPAPTSVPATPTATATATTTASTSTNTSSPRSARPKKTTRTPALTNGAPTQPGGGEVITGSVNVYTFDPEPSFTPVDASSVSLAHVLADLGADAAEWYQHVQTLSNPWFEGRAPGSEGIEYAAQYLAWWMQKYGLEPAFAEGSAANPDNPWRQPFELGGGGRKITSSSLDLASAQLAPRSTVVMKNSGAGTIEVPFAFAGYGIVDGKDGYTSFAADTRFDGHAVLVLRGEPLDAEGKSLWGGDKFTSASSLAAKLDAIASRGAAAILVAEPPGYAGKKANLAAMSAESLGGALDIPCFFVNAEAADAISKACDPQSRDLATLRALADAGTKDAPALPVIGKPDAKLAVAVAVDSGNTVTHNVGGILRGKGALAGEWLVIGAHYDHVGYGAYGADPENRGTVHPGADDNASGTSGMLLMAKRLAKRYAEAPADAEFRSVLFLGFSAEEIGLNGSRAWIKNASLPADKLDIMLNMDMIGRLRSKELVVGGVDSAHGLLDALRPMFIDSGLRVSADPSGRGPSDHAPFYGAGVPVLFFFSGVHDVYHKPGDQGYSVDPRGVPAVLDLVERIALWRAAAGTKLDYWNGVRTQEPAKDPAQAAAPAAPAGNDRGYAPVRLGIQPGLVESGESGIGVESVSEGTSAADAGIKPGDVLLAWNGESLDSVGTMMTKLRATKPGDVVKMRILRGNEELTIDVKMKASTAPRRPADE